MNKEDIIKNIKDNGGILTDIEIFAVINATITVLGNKGILTKQDMEEIDKIRSEMQEKFLDNLAEQILKEEK